MNRIKRLTATHWGTYTCEVLDDVLQDVRPFSGDAEPSSIGASIPGVIRDSLRIRQPMVREGYLRNGPRRGANRRGGERFVAVSWSTALDLAAEAIDRTRRVHGNEAIFGGSYGWSSAGRFHHAQSQVHRFLNGIGGYTRSVDTYSAAAMEVVLPHVLGDAWTVMESMPPWDEIREHAELIVAFGGLAIKNSQVNPGGVLRHTARHDQLSCAVAGIDVVNVSPSRDDTLSELGAEWLALQPNTDTAMMLGMAHTLIRDGLHDRDFLAGSCRGFEVFEAYVLGKADGVSKTAEWAAEICGVPATTIERIARAVAARRSLITVSWSVQRCDHGEQAYWMAVVLAAMSGSMGRPGGGFGAGYGAIHGIGYRRPAFQVASLPQGANAVRTFIPVARISDMLLEPGGHIDYNGQRLRFPTIRVVYWAGGNPFHHHQDLNRLVRAWQIPETVIVHEPWWNALARHADIVFPATMGVERNDIAHGRHDPRLIAMQRVVPPYAEARDDFEIFAELSLRLGSHEWFTQQRDEMQWLRWLYERTADNARHSGHEMPDFDAFWSAGVLELPHAKSGSIDWQGLRRAPEAHRLKTPSGRIEIHSDVIAGFNYADCPGHPAWFEPAEWLGAAQSKRYPLHLISNQPRVRLHSQLDNGIVSRRAKVAGREAITINPDDARARGIVAGAVVRVFNDRGACLAGAVVSDSVRPGVVQMATGAWYDPLEPGVSGTLEVHGNPNVLTLDKGTSRLAQGPSAQTTLVEIEPHVGPVPAVRIFDPPDILDESGDRRVT